MLEVNSMGRVVVQSYGNGMSKSAKELAEYLGVKRVKVTGSRFVGKNGDVVVNWGIPRNILANVRYLNDLEAVRVASNKLHAFGAFDRANVSTPRWWTSTEWVEEGTKLLARTSLNGHSGVGIVIGTKEDIVRAPLYVEYIEKKYEYRAIVVGDNVVDFKQKKKRASERDEEGNVIEGTRIQHDEHVWNLNGGYVFAREGVRRPDGIDTLAVDAIKALGLTYGAVDIIEDNEGKLYVLEVNTAFGLEGTTTQLVGEAIRQLLGA